MNREDEEIEKIAARRSALANAAAETAARGMAAEKRLAELNAQRGELVLAVTMGEQPLSDLLAARREAAELRDAIADAGTILEPVRRLENRLNGQDQKLSQRRLRRQEYLALRQKLADDPALAHDPGIVEPLRELCNFLDGNTSDADAAIAAAKQVRAA